MGKITSIPKNKGNYGSVDSFIISVEKTDIEFSDPMEAEIIQHNLTYMGIKAATIPVKIADASDKDMLYDLKMESRTNQKSR